MPAQINSNDNIIKTDEGAKDGQNKCPKCGATDIALNPKKGTLRCNFCRHEFEPQHVEGFEENTSNLQGEVMGSGATDLNNDKQEGILTLKCTTCGAEVVIDTEESTNARCHWCRSVLSVNQQVPNGAVPDVVLPFKMTKQQAKDHINKFVGKRKFYAHPAFKREFTTDNVMGVYFPYMIVDVNSHVHLSGRGEHQVRSYVRGSDNNKRTYYDADLYDVVRDFDMTINGLTVESSSDKLNKHTKGKTNNIINSIMPFDTENSVKFDANYLRGYTSEKRDTNIDDLKSIVDVQSKDIARFAANDTLQHYDRGVCWNEEKFDIKGRQWKSAYLPVWLYSYRQQKGNSSLLHYVAVNARTQETMGSVPIHIPKLLGISALVELIAIFFMALIDFEYNWLFLLSGIIYFCWIYFKYRNISARHHHESETKKVMSNLNKVDNFVKREVGLTNSSIKGGNNKAVNG